MSVHAIESIEVRRLAIRRRAYANALLILRDLASRSRGRFEVEGMPDAFHFRFRDVVTLVGTGSGFAIAPRDFTVIVVCPPLWPFDREAALVPIALAPMDFRHPNGTAGHFCVETRGISPESLTELLYDNIRLNNHRLDHFVDRAAADFVRSHLDGKPADPRPLYPEETP